MGSTVPPPSGNVGLAKAGNVSVERNMTTSAVSAGVGFMISISGKGLMGDCLLTIVITIESLYTFRITHMSDDWARLDRPSAWAHCVAMDYTSTKWGSACDGSVETHAVLR